MRQRYPKHGDRVNAIQKMHYTTGELTTGVVKDVLTKARVHSRGHKVRLTDGTIARVQSFVDEVGEQRWLEGAKPRSPGGYRPEELPGLDDLR